MATEKQGLWDRFMRWYESYDGKNKVNIIYSVGASVVIIGALFKILHWPGASTVLMIGMFTEAFLFLIGTLEHPHPEYHWDNVFPQLLEYGTKPELLEEKSKLPRPTLLGAGVAGAPVTAGLSNPAAAGGATVEGGVETAKVPTLKEEDLKALKDGIANLASTATQFAELSKVAQTGVKLNEKLAAAEVATEAYANATAGLAQSYAQISGDMNSVADETKAYKSSVEEVGKKLASLNSVYELQLQAVNAQIEAQKNAAAAAKEAAEAQVAFATGAKQLQKQVADLNGIYGNMLNALA